MSLQTTPAIAIECTQLSKTYGNSAKITEALRGVDCKIPQGQFVAIMGPSGSGKSTLLQLLGGLDTPTKGQILIEGQRIELLNDHDLSTLRRKKLGFIFQFFNLIPVLSALENAMLPALLDGQNRSMAEKRTQQLFEKLNLSHRLEHRPDQLSGGEMQRVAIARALINKPNLILADEPTGNLDSQNTESVLNILQKLCKEEALTLIMVTHDPFAASYADRKIVLRDGSLESDTHPL